MHVHTEACFWRRLKNPDAIQPAPGCVVTGDGTDATVRALGGVPTPPFNVTLGGNRGVHALGPWDRRALRGTVVRFVLSCASCERADR